MSRDVIINALKIHIKNKEEMSVGNQKTILKYINNKDKEIERLKSIIKEVREEIRILLSNSDIVDYQAQKLFQILDKAEENSK